MKAVAGVVAVWLLLGLAVPSPALVPGDHAPPFELPSLDGGTLSLDTLTRGGPVLLDFGSVFCTTCQEALRWLEGVRRTYRPRGLSVAAVNVDGVKARRAVAAVTHNLGVGYPVLLDKDGAVAEAYGVETIPFLVLVVPGGTVRAVHRGLSRDLDEFFGLAGVPPEKER